MVKAAPYPLEKSPDEFEGNKLPLNVDRWVAEGNVRFAWVVGTTWFAAMAASRELRDRVEALVKKTTPPLTAAVALDADGRLRYDVVLKHLKDRMAAGGMVLVNQDVYDNAVSELSDLVLPAAGWGEEDFARMQGERRLRLYEKIMDPPGESKPDWQIAAGVAQRMGFEGFDWSDSNAVFEEAAVRSSGMVNDYKSLVDVGRERGLRGHEFLRQLGSTGIQCPVKRTPRGLEGTQRLHEETFKTASGKACLVKGSWARVRPAQVALAPREGELWITNIRINGLWQSMYDDARIPVRGERFPYNLVEIHPEDAMALGIEQFDLVEIRNDEVPGHVGVPHAAAVKGVALVTDTVRRGVAACYFNFHGKVTHGANSVTPASLDPVSPMYRFKLGRGRVVSVGKAAITDAMSTGPRNLVR